MTVSESDSFIKRILAYTNERFPIIPVLITTVLIGYNSMYSTTFIFGESFNSPVSLNVILGLLSAFLVFFHLRLMDEFKDYAEDLKAYPDRLLSRGIVSKGDLSFLLKIVIVVEFILNIYLGKQIFICWAIIFIYSLLMYKEFFLEDFLNKHMALYLATHQAIIPLIIIYFISLAIKIDISKLFEAKGLIALFCMSITSFIFEIGRKTWNPEREHELADSYTKSWGIQTALNVLLVSGSSLLIGLYFFLGISFFYNWRGIVLIGVFILYLVTLAMFYKKSSAKNSKAIEATSSLLLLTNHLMMLLYALITS